MSKKLIASMTLTICCAGFALIPMPFRQWANLRNVGAVGALAGSITGYCVSNSQKAKQLRYDRWHFDQEQEQKLIADATRPIAIQTAVTKLQTQAEYALADHKDDVSAAYTAVMIDKYGEDWIRSQLPQPEPEQIALPEPELAAIVEEIKQKDESFAAKKRKLLKFITEHELGWIGQCMKKPILIYGDQGSGKSYFAEFLALCRYYLRGHQIISIADPHFHQNKDECWQQLAKLKVPGFGAHHNYQEVNSQIVAMFDRFSKRTLKSPPITSIFDEVTRYGQEEATQEAAAKLGSKLSSDPRKANESPIIVAHAKTLAALGGGDGFADAIRGNFIIIKLNSNSEQEPLWRGTISGIKDEDGELIENMKISIAPEWIRSSWVYELFNNDTQIPEKSIETESDVEPEKIQTSVTANKVDFLEQARKWLDDVYEAEAEVASPTTPWDEASEAPSKVPEVRILNTSAITSLIPEDARSKALARILTLLGEAGSASDEVIELMPTNPDRAVWVGIKILGKSMTATSRDIFKMGTGGKKFQVAKGWYELLKKEFDNA